MDVCLTSECQVRMNECQVHSEDLGCQWQLAPLVDESNGWIGQIDPVFLSIKSIVVTKHIIRSNVIYCSNIPEVCALLTFLRAFNPIHVNIWTSWIIFKNPFNSEMNLSTMINPKYTYTIEIKFIIISMLIISTTMIGNPLVSRERVESLETQTRTNEAKITLL